MASWTDTPVNFTPYIAEQPVEAMVQVGMTKQAQYVEGLQKVQTYVDTLGGLDVSKQEIKNYVQSKMNLLHQNLNNISGDFSDTRLVSQIGGAASKIANDPIVQNGIIATNTIKSGYQQMEAARKEGKSNPNNEIYFTDAVAGWQNDGQVDTKLTANYTPYYDIVGEVRKVFKDMTGGQELPSGFGSQNIKTDANGRVIFDLNYTGNQVLMEGIGVERVQHAIDLVMQNGSAQQQLKIDGYAKYRGIDAPQMFEAVVTSTQNQLAKINEAIKAAQSKLGGSTVGDKGQIVAEIKKLKDVADGLASRSENLVQSLGNNLEGVKAQLVEQELRTDLVGTLAYQKMVESPLWNANKELEKLNLDKDRFTFEQFDKQRNFDLDVAKHDLEKFKAQTAAEKEKKDREGNNYVADLPVPNTEGQAGSATMYKMKDDARAKAEEVSFQALSEYAKLTNQTAPYKLDPVTNKWVPNAEGFGGGKEGTEAAIDSKVVLLQDMKSRRTKGTLPPEAAIAMQKEESAWDEYYLVDKKIKDIETGIKPQIDEIKAKVGTRKDGSQYPNDWFDVVTVRNKLPGSEIADQRLKKKYGSDWEVGLTYGTSNSPIKGNDGEFREFQKKVLKNTDIVGVKQQIEDKFRGSQIAYQNKATVFDRNKPELQKDVVTAFTAALTEQSLVSPGGDAGDIKAWMNDKSEKQANDQYMAWSEYKDGKQSWWIGIQRGDELKKVEVKESTFRQNTKLQQAIPNVEFQNMFGARLGLRGGQDTFTDDNDIKVNAGQVSAYPVYVKGGSINYKNENGELVQGVPVVQYHLEEPATARGQYRLKLYITDGKTGKALVQGAPYPPSDVVAPGQTPALTQEQILDQVKNRLTNPAFIQGYLDKYYNNR